MILSNAFLNTLMQNAYIQFTDYAFQNTVIIMKSIAHTCSFIFCPKSDQNMISYIHYIVLRNYHKRVFVTLP